MTRILLAGDDFVRPDILRAALQRHLPDGGAGVEFPEITNGWPSTPFLPELGDVHEALGDEDALIAAAQGCAAIMTHTFPITRRVLEACPDLRIVTVTRGGPVNCNVEAATAAGVLVTYAPGRNATATAEHTITMILAATRQVAQRDAEIREHLWRGDLYEYEKVPPEIRGSTVGIVGYGAIGSRVARVLVAMGADVAVYDPYTPAEKLDDGCRKVEELDDLLRQARILTVHARVTEETRGMIGARELALLPRGAVVVNCARGPLLDGPALAEALHSGHLWAAGLDCLPEEPLADDSPLRDAPNLTMTPHLGGASKEAAELCADIGAADVAAFLAGERPRFMTNPEVLTP